MKRLYPLRIPFLLIILPLLSLLAAACNPFAAGPTPPPTPTPDVPSILEVDSAIKRWEAGNNRRYFVEVEEVNVEGTYLIRVVIADGEVRVAQRVEKVDGKWQAPVALDFAIAQNYTVDALLQRVRNDALGEGAAPMNMFVIFDTISGFPSVVETTALPTHNEQGQLRLNREHNYTLGVNVGVLIEDQVGLGKEPVMSLTRSGGANAWCDVLRIFPDGSSIYTDDCRQTLLQMRPPSASFAALEEISGGITGIDEWAENEGGRLHLVIYGAGGSDPDNTTLADTWELATELADLLSRPIGAGVTLLYTRHSVLFGFDMRTLLAQPTSVDIREPLYGALVSPDSGYLVHADGAGMHWLDTASGNSGIIFSNPSGAHYLPRGWGEQVLVLQRVPDKGDGTPEWGWTNLDDRSWHPIALKSGAFSCDDGVSVSPAAAEMVIAVGGEDCSVDVGLTLVYIEDGGIRNLVDPILTREAIDGGAYTPAWSPDGERIAVSLSLESNSNENSGGDHLARRIYLVRPDAELIAITSNTEGQATNPAWSPDGARLFYALTGAEIGEDGIYEYDFETGEHTLIVAGSDLVFLSVSPSGEFFVYLDSKGMKVWILTHGQVFPVAFASGENWPGLAGWLLAGGSE